MDKLETMKIICFFDNKNQMAIQNGFISMELYESLRDIIHETYIKLEEF